MKQHKIPVVYMRGGTTKGLFFKLEDLPAESQKRDQILLRLIGSPDPYGRQIDGLGLAGTSTSKVVLVSKSYRDDCDVDYLFGRVAPDRTVIDWSGSAGNLSAAVAPFAISEDLCEAPLHGTATVRIWQANLGKKVIAHVQMHAGEVVETGDFAEDGVAFPSAPIRLEFLDPAAEELTHAGGGQKLGLFPTGNPHDLLTYNGKKSVEATLVDAGNPTIFILAESLGLTATETKDEIDTNPALLATFEAIRAAGTVAMGLAATSAEATANRPYTPKLVLIGNPGSYLSPNGKTVAASDMDVAARIISIGRLHHAFTGTGAVALTVAATIPGTLVYRLMGGSHPKVRIGHPSGVITVEAEASEASGGWRVTKAVLTRTARRLMSGWVYVPRQLL